MFSRLSRKELVLCAFAMTVFLAVSTVADAAQIEQVYMRPPEAIAAVVDAPFTPIISASPDRKNILILHRPGLQGIDEVCQPELRIAGLRINPRTYGPSRARYYDRLSLRGLRGGDERPVTGLPENPKINTTRWSPDGAHIAMLLTLADRLELWVVDVASARAARLIDNRVNDTYSNTLEWTPDSAAVLVTVVPADQGEPPKAPTVPTGPVIQQSLGRKAPARTYQDLLENEHDEAVFEHYTTAQIVRAALDGTASPLGAPGIIDLFAPSPDGRFVLVQTVRKPFSYTVPAWRFPLDIAVWDAAGKVVKKVAELPLADDVPVPFGSVRTGIRRVEWRSDADATLLLVEALDGGDAGAEAGLRDRLTLLAAPFEADPQRLADIDHRYGGVSWGNDDLAFVSGWWWKTRNAKVWRVNPGDPDSAPRVAFEYSFEDRYSDPGEPLLRPTARGTEVLVTANDGTTIFLVGEGASPEGDRPFLDEVDVESFETRRLFRSEAPYYEEPVILLDPEKRLLVTQREAKNIQPNYWLRNLREDSTTQITSFPHPNPQFADVQKEMIRYTREDGVELTATLYLPAGYDAAEDGPLPMLMWAYPQEFKTASAAGQVTDSPHRFVRVTYWSPMLWLARGYAVLDDPAMPIVGEGDEEPNDTFVEQLVASARAAIDEVVRRGVADRHRIAIGGHSYGAFMTANLLAHSDLFAAGIARSGAYNRTLTPFGFQAEERTVWQAPEIYFAMSPFMHAEKVDEPILLIHGEADNNSGTYPLQSERFYGALKGLGATVRLCMLPHESHGYRARESIMHMLWEMSEWLDRYVSGIESED
jgi:dipeptidyl aminopeptidase/acylaminoacyl peptidase